MTQTSLASFRRAFTMLELVFVIVILGIVASISASIIAQVYESYIVQRALYRTSAKAEIAAMQIANRLTYRISSAVIGRKLDGTYLPLDQVPDETYKILEWIGYDNDSFTAGDMSSGATLTQRVPGWSGFCDVNSSATTRTTVSTPGSDLNKASAIIGKLSNSSKTISNAAIVFAGHEYNTTKNYIANCMGFTDNSCISPITTPVTATTMTLSDNNSKVMTDQYKLAWTAYAIVPTQVTGTALTGRGFKSTDTIYDLKLYYNYQPWSTNAASSYADAASNSTLVTNVKSFRFVGKGDTIRFKICVAEAIGDGNITSCKEKAVIR